MSKKIKRAKHKKNGNHKRNQGQMPNAYNSHAFPIEVTKFPAFFINPCIDETTIEVYPDYSCKASQGKVNNNWMCGYIDLQYVNYIDNRMFQLAFAHHFVDAGMRVFLEDDGVMVASSLDKQTFDAKLESIMKAAVDDIYHGEGRWCDA